LPAPPPSAAAVFGDRLALAERYVGHLGTTGVTHGLIGPREVPRLWERHVVNCAVLTDLLPHGATVIDIGSGAGLPGLTLAVRRPDLEVILVEPLLRRVSWLQVVIDDLGLADHVSVRRARAEELVGQLAAPFVTARAVAPLERLVRWGLPLLVPGGSMLAIKGRSAQDELDGAAELVAAAGCTAHVLRAGEGTLDEPTVVVRIDRGEGSLPDLSERSKAKQKGRARRPR
jgi:16S rRNA (guanine527-N7)-methyltransferase